MRWTIEGADSSTGRDLTVTVEARDEADAEQQARYNGVLVSRVYPFGVRPKDAAPVPVVEYATAATAKPPKASPAPVAGQPSGPRAVEPLPDYQPIVAAARSLVVLARVARVAALVLFAVAGLLPFVTAGWYSGGSFQWPSVGDVAAALFVAVWPAATGLAMLLAAAVLRMLAFVALAVRDIARNSFR